MRVRGLLGVCVAALALVGTAPPATAAESRFLLGAARVDTTPPLRDSNTAEPEFANCPPGLDGQRPFRFEEPYKDVNGNKRYDFGVVNGNPPEPFCDANQNQRYDGIFSSGAVDS